MPRIGLDVVPRLTPQLEQQLRTHLQHYQRLKQRQEALKGEVERWHEKIIDMRKESGLRSIHLDGYTIGLGKGRNKFDRRKFLSLGGDLGIYDASMTRGKEVERITLPKEQPE